VRNRGTTADVESVQALVSTRGLKSSMGPRHSIEQLSEAPGRYRPARAVGGHKREPTDIFGGAGTTLHPLRGPAGGFVGEPRRNQMVSHSRLMRVPHVGNTDTPPLNISE